MLNLIPQKTLEGYTIIYEDDGVRVKDFEERLTEDEEEPEQENSEETSNALS